MYNVFLILLFICTILLNIYKNNINKNNINKNNINKNNIENFISINNDPINDGKMKFRFLTNPNYGSNILKKYYLNDDSKTNNIRNVFHPYQQKTRRYYGNPKFCINDFKLTNAIYKKYGIRI